MSIPFSSSSGAASGGLSNPLSEDLDLQNNDILNVGTLNYTTLNPPVSGGGSSSSGSANDIQVADGSNGFTNNAGDTASSTAFTVGTTNLVVNKSNNQVGINKTPGGYALDINGSGQTSGATLSASNGTNALFFDNNGLQVVSADQTVASGNLIVGGSLRTDYANGKVLVGASSRAPLSTLEVLDTVAETRIQGSSAQSLTLYNTNGGIDRQLTNIQAAYASLTDSSVLTIQTRLNGSVNTRMYFKEDDRIGVGTGLPTASFHTHKLDSSDVVLKSSGTGTTETALKIETATASGSGVVFDLGGSTNQFVALNSGNVGVGQSAPSERFHVGNSSDTDSKILVENSSGSIHIGQHTSNTRFGLAGGSNIIEASSDSFGVGTQTNDKLVLGTNNSERLVILGNGNIGVGESAPTQKLEVNGAAALGNIKISSAHTDLGLMSNTTLSIDASSHTYRSFIVSTNGNNIQTVTPSNFTVNAQVVIYVYCTAGGCTLYGYTSTLGGTKSAHDDIALTIGDTAILTLTYDGTNYYSSAVKFQ